MSSKYLNLLPTTKTLASDRWNVTTITYVIDTINYKFMKIIINSSRKMFSLLVLQRDAIGERFIGTKHFLQPSTGLYSKTSKLK